MDRSGRVEGEVMSERKERRPGKGRMWTAEEIALLIELYSDSTAGDLSRQIGRTDRQIYMQAMKLGLRKSKEYLATPHAHRFTPGVNSGRRFSKGQSPWNKGLKGVNGKSNTVFKKGHIPKNHRPVGSQRMTKDGWMEIKVAEPNAWEGAHVIEWKKAHGDIPKGYIVRFIDGNRLNCDVGNLELISRAENMQRNTIYRFPPELVSVIRLTCKLRRQLEQENA